jgi:hypothetical protein
MGKIVVSQFVTLDGVFEDPGGAEGFERGGWALRGRNRIALRASGARGRRTP